jgi:hypothetical protein
MAALKKKVCHRSQYEAGAVKCKEFDGAIDKLCGKIPFSPARMAQSVSVHPNTGVELKVSA